MAGAHRRRPEGRDPGRLPLSRRFTVRYLIALALLGALTLFTKVSAESALDAIEAEGQAYQLTASTAMAVDEVTRLTLQLEGDVSPEARAAGERDIKELLVPLGAVPATLTELSSPPPELDEVDPALRRLANSADTYVRFSDSMDAETRAKQADQVVLNANTALLALRGQSTTLDPDTPRRGLLGAYEEQLAAEIDSRRDLTSLIVVLWLILSVGIILVLFRPMSRQIHNETSQLEEAERSQRENSERQTFRNDIKQALENTEDEDEIMEAVARGLVGVVPANKTELMLIDASKAHLRSSMTHPLVGSPECPVDSPEGCAAVRRGQALIFESSRMLNVCPKLPQHVDRPCSAVCIPLTFMSESLGVLHVVGPDGTPPSPKEIERLKVLAGESGSRLGTMRAMRATRLQADTDGLTGLLNRRTLESRARGLLTDGVEFSLAIGDLDHFKQLNDTHGHEAGDRALRLFSKVLKANLRPDDVAARYGGEEFVIILPGTEIIEAQRALERLQARLAGEIGASSSTPSFTASWGLTDVSAGESLSEIIAVADAALYDAKRNGRNCIMIDGEAVLAARHRREDGSEEPAGEEPPAEGAPDGEDATTPDGAGNGSDHSPAATDRGMRADLLDGTRTS